MRDSGLVQGGQGARNLAHEVQQQRLGHEAEIVELIVPDAPRHEEITSKPLRELDFPGGSLIGAVIRDGKAAIATGATVLRPGDDLLVVTTPASIKRVESLLE